ncbi:hypothetical protein [Candidatus Ichthyocystis sparus]|nr:hypothetical protein [Candidatus Ichthyocystis sparus]
MKRKLSSTSGEASDPYGSYGGGSVGGQAQPSSLLELGQSTLYAEPGGFVLAPHLALVLGMGPGEMIFRGMFYGTPRAPLATSLAIQLLEEQERLGRLRAGEGTSSSTLLSDGYVLSLIDANAAAIQALLSSAEAPPLPPPTIASTVVVGDVGTVRGRASYVAEQGARDSIGGLVLAPDLARSLGMRPGQVLRRSMFYGTPTSNVVLGVVAQLSEARQDLLRCQELGRSGLISERMGFDFGDIASLIEINGQLIQALMASVESPSFTALPSVMVGNVGAHGLQAMVGSIKEPEVSVVDSEEESVEKLVEHGTVKQGTGVKKKIRRIMVLDKKSLDRMEAMRAHSAEVVGSRKKKAGKELARQERLERAEARAREKREKREARELEKKLAKQEMLEERKKRSQEKRAAKELDKQRKEAAKELERMERARLMLEMEEIAEKEEAAELEMMELARQERLERAEARAREKREKREARELEKKLAKQEMLEERRKRSQEKKVAKELDKQRKKAAKELERVERARLMLAMEEMAESEAAAELERAELARQERLERAEIRAREEREEREARELEKKLAKQEMLEERKKRSQEKKVAKELDKQRKKAAKELERVERARLMLAMEEMAEREEAAELERAELARQERLERAEARAREEKEKRERREEERAKEGELRLQKREARVRVVELEVVLREEKARYLHSSAAIDLRVGETVEEVNLELSREIDRERQLRLELGQVVARMKELRRVMGIARDGGMHKMVLELDRDVALEKVREVEIKIDMVKVRGRKERLSQELNRL